MAEQRTLDLKHQAWAQRQRQTFMRQRQEKAMNYAQSGLPVRPTYFVNSGGMSSGEEVGGDGWGEEAAGGDGGALRPHTVHSAVSYQSRWGNGLEEGGEWGPRVRALTASGTISLPKPSFGKVRARVGAAWVHVRAALPGRSAMGRASAARVHAPPAPAQLLTRPCLPPSPHTHCIQIYDRMGAEINDSPRLAEFAWRQKRAAAKASKEVRGGALLQAMSTLVRAACHRGVLHPSIRACRRARSRSRCRSWRTLRGT